MNNIPQDTTNQNTAKYYFTKWHINNTILHPIHKKIHGRKNLTNVQKICTLL
jgi:hypothetical protein